MTVLRGRKLASKAWLISPAGQPPPPPPVVIPPPVTAPPGSAPTALSDITVTQNAPIWPGHGEATPVAFCDPVNGIGPFLWGLVDPSGLYRINSVTGDITVASAPVGSATHTLTVQCYDGRIFAKGPPYSPVSKTFTVAKSAVNASGMELNTRNPVHNCCLLANGSPAPQYGPLFAPAAYGADHSFTRDQVGITSDPSGKWARSTSNLTQWRSGQPVPGAYPVTFRASSALGDIQTLNTTLTVVQFTPIAYIELFLIVPVVSTSTLVGSVIGRLLATTPNNAPSWSISDPTGTVSVNAGTGEISLVKSPVAGAFQFAVSVVDGMASLSNYPITVSVQQGNILPPDRMTLTPNALDNSRQNQTVGTPAVTGIQGVKQWAIASQTGFNFAATRGATDASPYGSPNGFQQPARYAIDKNTGTITTSPATSTSSAAMLSFQRTDYNYIPDQLTITCTDGFNTCTNTFTIPVSEAPATYYHVERGTAPLYNGIAGADITRAQAMALVQGYHPGIKIVLIIYANADPDFYTDWTRSYRGFIGPGALIFVTVNGIVPRIGGSSTNSLASSGISVSGGKGHLVFEDGDWEVFGPVIISGVHGPDSSHGAEGIRKDGNTWGNLYITRARITDCDQGIETGTCHGYLTVDNCDISQCGGASVGSGLTHNLYIGPMRRATVRHCVSRRLLYGHLIKCRAVETIIDGCRLWDSSSGSAAHMVNLPFTGKVSIADTHMMKGPFASAPFVVSAGEEGPGYDTNTVTISGCTFDLRSIAYGGNYGPIVGVNHWFMVGSTGQPSSVTLSGNSFFFAPLSVTTSGDPHWIGGASATPPAGSTVETGTVTLALPPQLDVSDPVLQGGTLPTPGRPFRHATILESQPWSNWVGSLQMHGAEEFRVSRTAASGTAVVTINAIGDIIDNPSGNPFTGATTYSVLAAAGVNASNPNCFDTTGWAVTSNADGTGTLKTATTGLAAGLHFVQVRSVSHDGTHTSDGRYPVIVT